MSIERLEYAVIIECGRNNFSAYVPDLPGCVATGNSRGETETNIREAIRAHVTLLRELGQQVPDPTSTAVQVAV